MIPRRTLPTPIAIAVVLLSHVLPALADPTGDQAEVHADDHACWIRLTPRTSQKHFREAEQICRASGLPTFYVVIRK